MRPNRRPPAYPRWLQLPIAWSQQLAGIGGRARKSVIGEHHAVPNEHFVLYGHPLTDERMGRYLAAFSDLRAALNFHKRPNRCLFADNAPIEVNKLGLGYPYPFTEPHAFANRHLWSSLIS